MVANSTIGNSSRRICEGYFFLRGSNKSGLSCSRPELFDKVVLSRDTMTPIYRSKGDLQYSLTPDPTLDSGGFFFVKRSHAFSYRFPCSPANRRLRPLGNHGQGKAN